MPRVSVLVPIYNTNCVHLRQCIDSILNQTFGDFELIVLNDSPENNELDNVIRQYDDTRIRYIKNEYNMGISESRNKLIDLANGEYLAIHDHDDISHPTRFQHQVDFLDNNPYVGVVGTWAHWFGDKNFIKKNPEFDTDIKIKLTDVCAIMHTSAMIRKSVITQNNIKYEQEYTPAEDYRLWGQLIPHTRFHNLQTVLVEYRCDANNTSNTHKQKMDIVHNSIKFQICNKFPMYRQEFERRMHSVRFRLFGKIPLIKIKNAQVLLFDFIPIIKIKA